MTEQAHGPARRGLISVWLIAAVASAVLLGVIQLFQEPADDPDPAYQRPGVLDLAALPAPAPAVTPQLPRPGRPAVVFFERPDHLAALCAALPGTGLTGQAELVVVTSGPVAECDAVPVVADPAGRIAEGYGMRTPIDRGPPVGYAVVDATGSIRYRTLAPVDGRVPRPHQYPFRSRPQPHLGDRVPRRTRHLPDGPRPRGRVRTL